MAAPPQPRRASRLASGGDHTEVDRDVEGLDPLDGGGVAHESFSMGGLVKLVDGAALGSVSRPFFLPFCARR